MQIGGSSLQGKGLHFNGCAIDMWKIQIKSNKKAREKLAT